MADLLRRKDPFQTHETVSAEGFDLARINWIGTIEVEGHRRDASAWRAAAPSDSARPMPLSAASSAREMLTGLHAVMARRGSAQSKLDQVVDLIAEKMESDV